MQRWFPGLVGLACLAACGGSHSADPKTVLLTAAHLPANESLRIDMKLDETISSSGGQLGALPFSGQPVSLHMQGDVQNSKRVRMTISTAFNGQPFSISAVLYDGTAYVSTNGGTSYQTESIGSLPSTYSTDSALQYMRSVGTVSDLGTANIDGVAAEHYHANFDAQKMLDVLRSALGAVNNAYAQKLTNAFSFQGGSMEAYIDQNGRLVHEKGVYDASVNLGAFSGATSASDFTVHATFDGRLYDYGAAITVTKPASITAA